MTRKGECWMVSVQKKNIWRAKIYENEDGHSASRKTSADLIRGASRALGWAANLCSPLGSQQPGFVSRFGSRRRRRGGREKEIERASPLRAEFRRRAGSGRGDRRNLLPRCSRRPLLPRSSLQYLAELQIRRRQRNRGRRESLRVLSRRVRFRVVKDTHDFRGLPLRRVHQGRASGFVFCLQIGARGNHLPADLGEPLFAATMRTVALAMFPAQGSGVF